MVQLRERSITNNEKKSQRKGKFIMNYRQVHLDFHTGEKIPSVGKKFDKKQFQEALIKGHVTSITLFSKCHHGWAYHPSKANKMHPTLSFDLLGAQIEAAHEIGVKTPVYLSAGVDEKIVLEHPEWLLRRVKNYAPDFSRPGYHRLCFNSPYLDVLLEQIKEVCRNYDVDGIFLDIVAVTPCYCHNCMKRLIEEGKDPFNEKDVLDLAERVYMEYAAKVREAVDSVKPGLPVFHNAGHITRGRRDMAHMNTHLELESLPTGGWGYDHFPLSAGYARTLGMDFLGMTGKFHKTWAEFGGFKHPNALRYEVALSAACGAKCSIGDQLEPHGEMDMATYELIGQAYEELETKEPWLEGAKGIADVALLSDERVGAVQEAGSAQENTGMADVGAVRILLEGHYLFDVVDKEADFTAYKVLIIPDCFAVDTELLKKLKDYVSHGGQILASGLSCVRDGKFLLDLGAEYQEPSEWKPVYFRPGFCLESLGDTAFVCYSDAQRVKCTENGQQIGNIERPYFNRTWDHFSSHFHTANCGESIGAAITIGNDGAYIAWNVFTEYAEKGSLFLKRAVQYILDKMLVNRKTVECTLPAQGITTFTEQADDNRFVHHLLYASPVKRGDVEVIEDVIPIYDIECKLRTDKGIKRVYLAPSMEGIPFKQEEDNVKYIVPKVHCHQMVVLEYNK